MTTHDELVERDELIERVALDVLMMLNWCPQNSEDQAKALRLIAPIIAKPFAKLEAKIKDLTKMTNTALATQSEYVKQRNKCWDDRERLEVEAAAMRGALSQIVGVLESQELLSVFAFCATHGLKYEGPYANMESAKKALSTEAGKRVLDVVEAAREARKEAELNPVVLMCCPKLWEALAALGEKP